MGILNLTTPVAYNEYDEAYVRKALRGRSEPNGLPRSIKTRIIYHEDIVKTTEMVDEIPHEAFKKERHKVVLHPDHQSRKNWGCLYRACDRLEKCGVITSFTLRHDGELDVCWFEGYKKPSAPPKVELNLYNSKHLEPGMPIAEYLQDTRLEYFVGEFYDRPDTTPKVYFPDIVPDRFTVEGRLLRDKEYMHSEEARQTRARQKTSKETPRYLWNLNDKIKWTGSGHGIHVDVVHGRPYELLMEIIHKEKEEYKKEQEQIAKRTLRPRKRKK